MTLISLRRLFVLVAISAIYLVGCEGRDTKPSMSPADAAKAKTNPKSGGIGGSGGTLGGDSAIDTARAEQARRDRERLQQSIDPDSSRLPSSSTIGSTTTVPGTLGSSVNPNGYMGSQYGSQSIYCNRSSSSYNPTLCNNLMTGGQYLAGSSSSIYCNRASSSYNPTLCNTMTSNNSIYCNPSSSSYNLTLCNSMGANYNQYCNPSSPSYNLTLCNSMNSTSSIYCNPSSTSYNPNMCNLNSGTASIYCNPSSQYYSPSRCNTTSSSFNQYCNPALGSYNALLCNSLNQQRPNNPLLSAPPGYTKGLNPIAGSQTVGQTRIPGYSHPSSYAVPLSITYGFLVSQYSKLTAPVVQLGVSDPSQVESLTYNVQFIAPKDFKLNVQATLINKQVCSGSVLVTDRKSTMQLNCK